MPEETQLLLYNPCHEQWGDMTPEGEGRFCGSCQKIVIDFTMMSDRELLEWFSRGTGNVCGRMTEDQLGRDLVSAGAPVKSRWGVWWQLLLAGLLVSSEVSAQVKPSQVGQHKTLVKKKLVMGCVSRPLPQEIWIIDSATERSVQGASVQMDDGIKYFVSDSAGRVVIPYDQVARASSMKISSIGYANVVVRVDEDWLGEDKVVKLTTRAMELSTVSVVAPPNNDHRSIILGGAISVRRLRRSWFSAATNTIRDTLLCRKSPLTVYPNPVSRGASITLSLHIDQQGDYMAQLFNISGAVVESMRLEGVDKTRTELMEIPGTLAAGIYFVRVFHLGTGKLYTEKVVVM